MCQYVSVRMRVRACFLSVYEPFRVCTRSVCVYSVKVKGSFSLNERYVIHFIEEIANHCGIAHNDAFDLASKDGRTRGHSRKMKISFNRADAGRLSSLMSTELKTSL